MGFEEFFENKDNQQGNFRVKRYPVNNGYDPQSSNLSDEQDEDINWLNILQKIRSNKKLKIFVILAGLLVLTIVIVLIIVLWPLILKLINSISQNGLQGILNDITGFIDKLLKGSAN